MNLRLFTPALALAICLTCFPSIIQAALIAEYRFDECQYTGTGYEVLDQTTSYNARAENGVNINEPGQIQRYADLQTQRHSFRPSSPIPIGASWSVNVWFKMPFLSSQLYHVLGALAGGGDLMFLDKNNNYRWGVYTASGKVRNGTFRFGSLANGWHHLALVGNSGRTSLYIDGSFQESVKLQATGNLDYIATSYDNYGTANAQGFGLPLDELLIFDQAISAAAISAIYTNQLAGNNYDGSTRSLQSCNSVDHYEIHHDGSALTCEPEHITIKACANADCSALYGSSADVTLSPAGWVGGDNKTFTGSVDYELGHTTAESVILGMTAANPAAPVTCYENGLSGDCTILFDDSGFVFDVPTQVACKTSSAVTIKAVKKDDDSQKCVPAFANRTEDINFWSTYINPGSGTESTTVNSTSISGSSPGTAISLNFDSDGEAPFTVVYLDAGNLQLDASFSGSGDEAGLEMTGSDTFVVRPAGLCVYSDDANADCASGDATCSKFTQAGQTFNLKVKAMCWEADSEADTDFCDNSVTANFELAGITVAQNLVSPVGGSSGSLAVTSFDMAASDNGEHAITQSISEVGVFTFTADPPSYLGLAADAIPTSTSENIGRFYPAEFTVSANSPQFADSCTAGNFTYLGQEFAFATEPIFTVTALNTSGATTLNYASNFWKLGGTLANRTYSNQASTAASLSQSMDGGNATLANHNDLDGSGTLTVSGDRLTYAKPASPETSFAALVDLDLTAADLTDADNVCYDSDSDGTCDGYTISVSGTNLYWGRLRLQNNFGPETEDLSLPLSVQYFNGTDFVTHTADSCSQVTLSFNSYSGNLTSGEICVQDSGSPGDSGEGCAAAGPVAEQFLEPPLLGDFNLFLKAPGTDNDGIVNVTGSEESGAAWLQYDWDNDGSHDNDPAATAIFGIYRGNDRIINWQEISR